MIYVIYGYIFWSVSGGNQLTYANHANSAQDHQILIQRPGREEGTFCG
jgi:hypothetical protein